MLPVYAAKRPRNPFFDPDALDRIAQRGGAGTITA
jgi:hypothetical protein